MNNPVTALIFVALSAWAGANAIQPFLEQDYLDRKKAKNPPNDAATDVLSPIVVPELSIPSIAQALEKENFMDRKKFWSR